jgi:hypothetical protein
VKSSQSAIKIKTGYLRDGQVPFLPTLWRAFWSGFNAVAPFAVSGVDQLHRRRP